MKPAIRTCRIIARVTPEELAQIEALAAALGTTKTNAVVRAVEIALIRLPKEASGNGEEESTD